MSVQGYHLAQINLGRMVDRLDSPAMAEFVTHLEGINTLAERSPGFVWRLAADAYTEENLCPFEDKLIIVNMSVWESVEHLQQFVYRSSHGSLMRRRKEWFTRMEAYLGLWWIKAGHIPTLEEGTERLDHLCAYGESAYAFTFRRVYPPA